MIHKMDLNDCGIARHNNRATKAVAFASKIGFT
jgi:hypothetical protein